MEISISLLLNCLFLASMIESSNIQSLDGQRKSMLIQLPRSREPPYRNNPISAPISDSSQRENKDKDEQHVSIRTTVLNKMLTPNFRNNSLETYNFTTSTNIESYNINYNNVFVGDATFFTPGLGACGQNNSEEDFIAAINAPQYGVYANPNKAFVCGQCVLVKGALGEVKVAVTDKCPLCKHGDLDLSPAAFAKIGKPKDGRIPILWLFVSC